MNLKELIKKIDKINKMNKDLDFNIKYYLVIENRFFHSIYIFNSKDLKKITDYYTECVSSQLINSELLKEERYLYTITINNEKYDIRIGIE